MKLQAQFDKLIPQAEESLRMCITGPNSQPLELEWDSVLDAMSACSLVFDGRLQQLNERLLADSGLLVPMTEAQRMAFYEGFDLLFPAQDVMDFPVDGATFGHVKVQVSKHTSSGEVITFELSEMADAQDMRRCVMKALDAIDDRLLQENLKKTEYMEFYRGLTPEDQMILQIAFDAVFGRTQAENAAQRLEGHRREMAEREAEQQQQAQKAAEVMATLQTFNETA